MKKTVILLITVFCFLSSFSQPTLDVFPNPFYDTTTFIFTLPENDTVSLMVYDRWGSLIDSVIKKLVMQQGTHTVIFIGDTLPQAMYYLLLVVDTNLIGKSFVKSDIPIGFKDYRIKEPNLEIYPNPVGQFGIKISYQLSKNFYMQFKLFDYTGKEILTINRGY